MPRFAMQIIINTCPNQKKKKKIYPKMLTAALFTVAERWGKPSYPPTNKLMSKMFKGWNII